MGTSQPRFIGSLLGLVIGLCAQVPQRSTDGQQQFANLGNCQLDSGQEIIGCRVGYRTWGKLNAQKSNAVLFLTWLGGKSADIEALIGADKLLDPRRFFIVAVDAFGDGVSSSPSNSTVQPRLKFPTFTIRDMVTAEHRLAVEELHLTGLHAVMGFSMGGMQVFEWAVARPDFLGLAVPIAASPRLTSYDLLVFHAQKDALKSDPAWQNGNYSKPPPLPAVRILEDLNLTTPADYARRHPREKFAENYAKYTKEGISPFDANDALYQLEAVIQQDIAHGHTLADAAKRVKARLLVVAARQDHMLNYQTALDFAALLGAQTLVLDSDCGHLSLLCEVEKLTPVKLFLEER
jgi:homoserine O-acetyltransferase